MLAAKTDTQQLLNLTYPVLVSPKLDGVRALIGLRDGKITTYSRSMIPIPNRSVQAALCNTMLHGMDGELVVGSPTHKNCMQITMSGVMTIDRKLDFQYYVFDRWDVEANFSYRLSLCEFANAHPNVIVLPHELVSSYEQLLEVESTYLAIGYEGIMLRGLSNLYKQGRSTFREKGLLKVKRFNDSEAEILSFNPLYHNTNPEKISEIGLTKRSSELGGMVAADTLGSLEVRDIHTGIKFEIGTGFTEAQRLEIWKTRKKLFGSVIKYKHFTHGVKVKPRFPVFVGFRSKLDF